MPTVLHLPGSYLPSTLGGKEVYTHSLVSHLTSLGWRNHVAFHQAENQPVALGSYQFENAMVEVLPPLERVPYVSSYSCRMKSIPGFEDMLDSLAPDIVHFHDFGWSVNLDHLDAVMAHGARTIMTFHSPGQACQQRELLFAGNTPCDGQLLLNRCTECRLLEQGLPWWVAKPLSRISLPLAQPGQSKFARGVTARTMSRLSIGAWQEMIGKIDALHVQADWIREMMRLNQVPEEKLAFFRSGLPGLLPQQTPSRTRADNEPLKIIMIGRCEEIKGQHVLIAAIQRLSRELPVEVSFLGPYWDSTAYGRHCLQLIQGDTRFQAPHKVPPDEVTNHLAMADVLAVPSTWLETGPLVVLEAFAQKVPVVGSNRGGIAELVQHERNGWLFPVGDTKALADVLERLIRHPQVVETVRQQIQPPRTMLDTARDTAAWYEKLLAQK
jgi:glycosyltransferase involved in cell wall biosynthesis